MLYIKFKQEKIERILLIVDNLVLETESIETTKKEEEEEKEKATASENSSIKTSFTAWFRSSDPQFF